MNTRKVYETEKDNNNTTVKKTRDNGLLTRHMDSSWHGIAWQTRLEGVSSLAHDMVLKSCVREG